MALRDRMHPAGMPGPRPRRRPCAAGPVLSLALLTTTLQAWAATPVDGKGSFTVGATVASGCQVAGSPSLVTGLRLGRLDFGTHSALQTGIWSVNLSSVANQSLVQCTPGVTMNVEVDAGQHASGLQRRLANGNGQFLAYALFMTSSGNQPLVPGTALGMVMGASPTALPVMGMVTLPGAGAVAGTYTDTVQVTLSW